MSLPGEQVCQLFPQPIEYSKPILDQNRPDLNR